MERGGNCWSLRISRNPVEPWRNPHGKLHKGHSATLAEPRRGNARGTLPHEPCGTLVEIWCHLVLGPPRSFQRLGKNSVIPLGFPLKRKQGGAQRRTRPFRGCRVNGPTCIHWFPCNGQMFGEPSHGLLREGGGVATQYPMQNQRWLQRSASRAYHGDARGRASALLTMGRCAAVFFSFFFFWWRGVMLSSDISAARFCLGCLLHVLAQKMCCRTCLSCVARQKLKSWSGALAEVSQSSAPRFGRSPTGCLLPPLFGVMKGPQECRAPGCPLFGHSTGLENE